MAFDAHALARPLDGLEPVGRVADPTRLDPFLFQAYSTALECDARVTELAVGAASPGEVAAIVREAREFRVNTLRALTSVLHSFVRSGNGSVEPSRTGSSREVSSVGSNGLRGVLRARALGSQTALARLPNGLCYLKAASAVNAERAVDSLRKFPTVAKVLSRPADWFNSVEAISTLRVTGQGVNKHVTSTGSKGVKMDEFLRDAAAGRDWPVGSLGASFVARWPGRLRSSDEVVRSRLGGVSGPRWLPGCVSGSDAACFYCAVEEGSRVNGVWKTRRAWDSLGAPGSASSAEKWMGHVARGGCSDCGLPAVAKVDKAGHLAARSAARWIARCGDPGALPVSGSSARARAECLLKHGMAEVLARLGVVGTVPGTVVGQCAVYVCPGHSGFSPAKTLALPGPVDVGTPEVRRASGVDDVRGVGRVVSGGGSVLAAVGVNGVVNVSYLGDALYTVVGDSGVVAGPVVEAGRCVTGVSGSVLPGGLSGSLYYFPKEVSVYGKKLVNVTVLVVGVTTVVSTDQPVVVDVAPVVFVK